MQPPVLPRISLPCVLALAGALSSCSDEVRPVIEVNENPAVIPPSADDACKDEDDGAPCADDRLCVAGRCVLSTCGDGVQADGEACDDGNAAAGDGCSPACSLEYTLCPTGEYVLAGSECKGTEQPVAGDDAGVEVDCIRTFIITASVKTDSGMKGGPDALRNTLSFTTVDASNRISDLPIPAGDTVRLAVGLPLKREKAGQFVWGLTTSQAGDTVRIWTFDGLSEINTPYNSFKCPEQLVGNQYFVRVTLMVPGCPLDYREFRLTCGAFVPPARDAGTADAGTGDAGTDGGAIRDAAVGAAASTDAAS